ncbi:hypothetical protein niasHT_019597 [Heterodera trifolii]|uniref:Flavin-containing monooxygenase n=1 Tax=Heterodera trifolii TaxID=157864 RepID=A0ABD2L802_9BILA
MSPTSAVDPTASTPSKRCAIVGAGACGLACARWALAYGFRPVVIERRQNLGGLWRYTDDPLPDELATVMRCTVTNSSKELTAFSDFPPDPQLPNYMRHDRMLAYLAAYARHHNLEQYILFGQKVTKICRSPNYAETGQWTVQRENEGNGEQIEDIFHCVLVAIGHHAKPNWPNWEGMAKFGGKIIHSHDFRRVSPDMEQKVNVVVGASDSAADMAVELSRVSKEVLLSTRRGFWVLRKCAEKGLPVDSVLTTRFSALLSRYAPRRFNEWRRVRFFQKGLDHAMYGIMPDLSPLVSQFFTVNDELPVRMLSGMVTVKPDIGHFTENGIVWADGTRTDQVGNVLLGTGYRFDFTLIERGQLLICSTDQSSDNGTATMAQLYKHMFPLGSSDWNTLAIVGIVQPTGSKLCVAEMQARLFFAVQCGQCKLPSTDEMRAELAKTRPQGPMRHAHEVDYIGYMDDLAALVGCAPSLWRLLCRLRLRLFRAVLFGPNVSYVYRLGGPHQWAGAEQAVLNVQERMRHCLRTRECRRMESNESTAIDGMALTMLIMLITAIFIVPIAFITPSPFASSSAAFKFKHRCGNGRRMNCRKQLGPASRFLPPRGAVFFLTPSSLAVPPFSAHFWHFYRRLTPRPRPRQFDLAERSNWAQNPPQIEHTGKMMKGDE